MNLKKERGTLTTIMTNVVDDSGNSKVNSLDVNSAYNKGVIPLHIEEGGKIVNLVMVFTYPDESQKLVVYDKNWIDETEELIIDENAMSDKQKESFRPKPDWKENPAMICVLKNKEDHASCYHKIHL